MCLGGDFGLDLGILGFGLRLGVVRGERESRGSRGSFGWVGGWVYKD